MALSIRSTVRLNNGVAMPLFGLGTWRAPKGPVTQQAVRYALEIGYRLIDTAAAYGNEEDVGIGVRESGIDRAQVFVTTKVQVGDQGYDETLRAFRHSLRLLDMEYIDLYLIHWPERGRWPASWRAMETLLAEGTCRAIGVSNFEIHHLEALHAASTVAPAVNQVEFSPFLYRTDLLDYSRQHGIRLEGYSPLTRGARLHDPRLRHIADKYGKTPAQILIRWSLQHDVVAIPKSANPHHIRENADVFDVAIAAEDMSALDNLNEQLRTGDPEWRKQFE